MHPHIITCVAETLFSDGWTCFFHLSSQVQKRVQTRRVSTSERHVSCI